MAHLGIDEHRRGRARFAADPQTGEYTLLADRWHTRFLDPDGQHGPLGQVEDRTADDAAYWLAGATHRQDSAPNKGHGAARLEQP